MLNKPDDDPTTTSAGETPDTSNGTHATQIILIALVGGYLFGMIWIYAHLPWLLVSVTGVAALLIVLGFIHHLRRDLTPPEE